MHKRLLNRTLFYFSFKFLFIFTGADYHLYAFPKNKNKEKKVCIFNVIFLKNLSIFVKHKKFLPFHASNYSLKNYESASHIRKLKFNSWIFNQCLKLSDQHCKIEFEVPVVSHDFLHRK